MAGEFIGSKQGLTAMDRQAPERMERTPRLFVQQAARAGVDCRREVRLAFIQAREDFRIRPGRISRFATERRNDCETLVDVLRPRGARYPLLRPSKPVAAA
jgi:hypothetical protein